MRRALVVLSGGQDSSTLLAHVAAQMPERYDEVRAVTFHYGQRHSVEVDAARNQIMFLEGHGIFVPHEVVPLGPILLGTSPLVSGNEVESYADAASLPGGLEKTFVPMRNALFLVLAGNRAACMGKAGDSVDVYTGVSQEDFGGYPDCRENFIDAIEAALREAVKDDSMPRITIATPLIHLTKKQTVEMAEATPWGRELNALSHTCYKGEVPPCGHCHACLLRQKGYAEAGIVDPLLERLGRGL